MPFCYNSSVAWPVPVEVWLSLPDPWASALTAITSLELTVVLLKHQVVTTTPFTLHSQGLSGAAGGFSDTLHASQGTWEYRVGLGGTSPGPTATHLLHLLLLHKIDTILDNTLRIWTWFLLLWDFPKLSCAFCGDFSSLGCSLAPRPQSVAVRARPFFRDCPAYLYAGYHLSDSPFSTL